MAKYVANMDLQIDGKLFRESETITVKMKKSDIAFLLENGMILEQEDIKVAEAEGQKTAEPEKKNQGQKAKAGKQKPVSKEKHETE